MAAVRLRIALTVFLAALVGCGSGGGGNAPAPEVTKVSEGMLNELKEMLPAYSRTHKAPPTKAAEFNKLEPAFPDAVRLINSGECVYVWGSGLAAGSQAVLAHGKDAATAGGWVLLQDGTVKQMTAAEFTAAPKAKK